MSDKEKKVDSQVSDKNSENKSQETKRKNLSSKNLVIAITVFFALIIIVGVGFNQLNNDSDNDSDNSAATSSESSVSVSVSSIAPEEDPNLSFEDFEGLDTSTKVQNLANELETNLDQLQVELDYDTSLLDNKNLGIGIEE